LKNDQRAESHQRNSSVESILQELTALLGPINQKITNDLPHESFPTIHIVGCARSGSTLLHQLLVKHLDVAYPSNFLSRFFYAPHIGAKLQFLLSDLDTKKENLAAFPAFQLSSELGKTSGPLAPHEFWYYWRSVFDVCENGWIKTVNKKTLTDFYSGIDSITHVYQKPFVLKSMIGQNAISQFLTFRKNDIVIYIKRDVAFNAQSLLQARKSYFGDIQQWYSFVPDNYEIGGSPYKQVVDQVLLTNAMIEDELEKCNSTRVFKMNYEELGTDFPKLIEKLPIASNLKRSTDNFSSLRVTPAKSLQLQSSEFDQIKSYL
jgi:hypothetical protein